MQALLVHPKNIPHALIAALARELAAVKAVRGAWLMMALQPAVGQSWMLGVEHDGAWPDVQAAIGRAVAGGVLDGWLLDAMPLDNSSFASTLRSGIPVIAAQGG